MPIKAVKKFTAWSYSRLSDYEACPRRAKFKHLDKLVEPAGPALERGGQIHKEAEAYVRRRVPELPKSLERFPAEFAALRARDDVETELQLAVTREWRPCDWFGADAWLRIVVDATHAGVAATEAGRVIIDYKTGKMYPDKVDQLDLYGLVALAYHAGVRRVDSALWYLDQGEIINRVLVRAEAPAVRQRWEERVVALLADERFDPKPGNACRFCWFGQGGRDKGGPGLCEL
jgi:CRISPR/Cas system-associated exonuclease Cas4 (RecB family)